MKLVALPCREVINEILMLASGPEVRETSSCFAQQRTRTLPSNKQTYE